MKVTAFATAQLQLIFENTDLAGIGDTNGLQGSSTPGSFFLALFTADPTATGSITNEADYTGYAREAVVRSTAGWTTTAGVVTNDAAVTFDECTGGDNDITHMAVCKAGTDGVADLCYVAYLTTAKSVVDTIVPEFAAGDIIFREF